MKNPGPFVRERFPRVYFFLVAIINAFIRISRPYSIYITDSLGGSFKSYLNNPDKSSRISDLKRNLDEESISTINTMIERFLKYPDEKDKLKTGRYKEILGGLLPAETDQTRKFVQQKLRVYKKNFKLLSGHIEESVFYYNHGLILLPGEVIKYIEDNDFIDAGAFIGDSAIALRDYHYRKIYSFEISQKSIERYRHNMKSYNISTDKFEIINAIISADEDQPPADFADTGSSGLSLLRKSGKYDFITVEQKSLDYLVDKHKITPRFIKADIEGNGLDFVRGTKMTLLKYRPVLSIAIYHNPYEFFEVKPLLEELLDNYVFLIRKLTSGVKNNNCHSEVVLLGYPAEIIKSPGYNENSKAK